MVACYVESRRRAYGGQRGALSSAKRGAADVFDGEGAGVEDAESAIKTAWTKHGGTFAHHTDAMISGLLVPWESGESSPICPPDGRHEHE